MGWPLSEISDLELVSDHTPVINRGLLPSVSHVADEFEQLWLPYWPLASDDLLEGIYRQSRASALGRRYIEANPTALANLLVVDVDHPDAALRALSARGSHPLPNAIVGNRANGHAHAVWALNAPVPRTEYARRKPLAYMAACAEGLRRAVDGDRSYSGLMTKNPGHIAWETEWLHSDLYTLSHIEAELGANMPPPRWRQQTTYKAAPTPLGRNCALFDSVRLWAYRPALMRIYLPTRNVDGLGRAIYAECHARNAEFPCNDVCPGPLPDSEVRAIANSIWRWITTKSRIWADGIVVYEATLSARQSAISRKGAAARTAASTVARRAKSASAMEALL
uniref:Primase C-terminal 1 domain-containing protein n=3 Tax=Mycolicibacterium TaxID=1866885 RepID=Q52148_MYCFO|nr:unknown protein [Mycolicibacterium fortuitum]